MKKNILQALFLFLLACSVNISLYTKPQVSTPENPIQSTTTIAQVSYVEKSEDGIISQFPLTTTSSKSLAHSAPLDDLDQIITSVGPKKEDAHFLVNTSRDTILQCPEGSILKVNANSFVDALGNTVQGEVKVKVKECYKLKDIIANKLGTTCDGKLIETAGMLNITVTAGDNELMLAEGKEMGIAMPAGRGSGYELFYGEPDGDGLLNWVLDEENPVVTKYIRAEQLVTKDKIGKPLKADLDQLFEMDTTCQFGITKMILQESMADYQMQEFNFKDHNGNKLSDFLMSRFTPDKKTKSYACAAKQSFSVNLKIDHHGNLLNAQVDETISEACRSGLRKILKEAPVLNRNYFDPYSDNRERLKIVFGNKLMNEDQVQMISLSDDLNAVWTGVTQNWMRKGKAEPLLSYYVMTTLKLNWINCDRFSQNEILSNITIESKDPSVEEIIIVFEDTRSAICGNSNSGIFHCSLPINKRLRVISLSNQPGKQKMATYRINSGPNGKYIIDDLDTSKEPNTEREMSAPA